MKRLFLVLALAAASLTACGPTDNYAAKVNGTEISTKTMDDELHAITSNPRFSALLNQSLSAGNGLQPGGDNTVSAAYTASLLYNRVLVTLIDNAVAKEKVVVTPQQRTAAENAVRTDMGDEELFNSLPDDYRNYLIGREASLSALLASRDTEAAQRVEYEKNTSNYSNYCIRHILVQTQGEAAAIRNRILNGEDFATIAKADSLDNGQGQGGGSAAEGGALGCVSGAELSGFVEPFRDAALRLQQGELSEPVQTDFGFHLVQITAKTQQTFEQVKAEISSQLTSRSNFFTEAVATAKVKVNPRYGTFHPANASTGAAAQIAPPTPVALSPPTSAESADPNAGLGGSTNSGAPQAPVPPQ